MENRGKKSVYLISLGCAKNLVDSENILGILRERNFAIGSDLEEAEIAVINTCGFIQSAVEESIDTIVETASFKGRGKLRKLFVVGCLVQRYGYKLRREMPEVDGWLGTGEIDRIAELLEDPSDQGPPFFIERPTYLADHTVPRVRTTPFYTGYLKIAEGCSHGCSFCAIPDLRGPFRSRDPDSLVIESEKMAEKGVIEINLVAQDTAMYGRDLNGSVCLEDLLERLLSVKGLKWIRILYCNPPGISDRLLKLIETESVLCPYLDLPLQHIDQGILRAMGRPFQADNIRRLIERIRSLARRVSMRSTFMVGFPGETDDIFDALYAFVKETGFDNLGVFVFSPEKGTPAARLKGAPPPRVAKKRRDALMGLQAGISKKKNLGMVGRIVPVLLEGLSRETELLLAGRTQRMAPEVDGQVLINKGHGTMGEILPVRITEAHPYDLIGEIVHEYRVEFKAP